jgi:hypothetical protein
MVNTLDLLPFGISLIQLLPQGIHPDLGWSDPITATVIGNVWECLAVFVIGQDITKGP